MNKQRYVWLYDHVMSRWYDLMITWVAIPLGGERRFREAVLEPVSLADSTAVLEMCCGTGGATVFIARKAPPACRITAMDLSTGQLRRAAKKAYACAVEFVEGDVTRTPFADETFDTVFISHAIHEMPRALRVQALREALRVCRPGGRLVVLEIDNPPNAWWRLFLGLWWFYWLPGNFETATRRDMFKHGLDNEVRESGFVEVQKHTAFGGALQTVEAVKPPPAASA